MIDIKFYMDVADLKFGNIPLPGDVKVTQEILSGLLEGYRNQWPTIFNIETTNKCNMHCVMCPRTEMTRPLGTMPMKLFNKIISQVRPWRPLEWEEWKVFVKKHYKIQETEMHENHFFTYIVPKVITLHGFGEPLLDTLIPERIRLCRSLGIPTYFSCNPCNLDKFFPSEKLLEAGLDYLKFSTDSVDDFSVKQIRGMPADFSDSLEKINKLIKLVEENNYRTQIIITMLDLNRPNQVEEFEKLKQKFAGKNVYIYLKSQDQKWHFDGGAEQRSIHWSEFCQSAWSSMSIQWNGDCVPCHVDYNGEMVLGNAAKNLLMEIWNGKNYAAFRGHQIYLRQNVYNTKCFEKCDMQLAGSIA